MKNSHKSNLLTPDEAAAYLRISRATFDRQIKAGDIPPGIKISDRIERWRVATLDDYINRKEEETNKAKDLFSGDYTKITLNGGAIKND